MEFAAWLWHVLTGRELMCLKGQAQKVNAIAFDRAGKSLAAAIHDGAVKVWRTADEDGP